MSCKHRYTVTQLQSGQSGPYTDSVDVFHVLIEWQGLAGFNDKAVPFVPWDTLADNLVRERLRGLCGGWNEKPGSFDRQLNRLTKIGEGLWEAVIVEPYCD